MCFSTVFCIVIGRPSSAPVPLSSLSIGVVGIILYTHFYSDRILSFKSSNIVTYSICSGFNLYPRRREHCPTPATHTCVRESRANQRSPRVSLRPPYYKARRRHIATPAGASSTRDGRETTGTHCKPRGTT